MWINGQQEVNTIQETFLLAISKMYKLKKSIENVEIYKLITNLLFTSWYAIHFVIMIYLFYLTFKLFIWNLDVMKLRFTRNVAIN